MSSPFFTETLMAQLECYGMLWVAYVLIAFLGPRNYGFWGLLLGFMANTGLTVVSDLIWIQGEMSKPDWDGTPDQDFVFAIGVMIRIFLVNFLMIPISLLGLLRHYYVKEALEDQVSDPREVGPPTRSSL